MEFKKYILKKFDYNVNVSNKKFYTPDEALDISESFIKKILSKFYPIFSKLILNFYNSIGLDNIQLPEFWAKEKGIQKWIPFFNFICFHTFFHNTSDNHPILLH